VFNTLMNDQVKYDQNAILEHIRAGIPANTAPGINDLMEHVGAIARMSIRQRGDFSDHVIDEAVSDIIFESWPKLDSGDILVLFDPDSGSQLATFLAYLAPMRALDRLRSHGSGNLSARRIATESEHIEDRYVEALEDVQLRLLPDRKMTRPLQCLCVQLMDRLDWGTEEVLKGSFRNQMKGSAFDVLELWNSARSEAKDLVDLRLEALHTSVNYNLGMAPDPDKERDDEARRERRRRLHSRLVESRKRQLIAAAIEYSFFPLQAAAIQVIFGLNGVANAQKVRSRSREEFFTHLTTGSEDEDATLIKYLDSVRHIDDFSDLDDEEFVGTSDEAGDEETA
jgi:hypothetical protein